MKDYPLTGMEWDKPVWQGGSMIEIINREDFCGNKIPYGIRDEGGYLLFFHKITKYSGQADRYIEEIKQLTELANRLIITIKEDKKCSIG